jgi:hypothetical protein
MESITKGANGVGHFRDADNGKSFMNEVNHPMIKCPGINKSHLLAHIDSFTILSWLDGYGIGKLNSLLQWLDGFPPQASWP